MAIEGDRAARPAWAEPTGSILRALAFYQISLRSGTAVCLPLLIIQSAKRRRGERSEIRVGQIIGHRSLFHQSSSPFPAFPLQPPLDLLQNLGNRRAQSVTLLPTRWLASVRGAERRGDR